MPQTTPADQLLYATVPVTVELPDSSQRTGTAFFLAYQHGDHWYDFLVTNKHVIDGGTRCFVTFTRAHNQQPLIGQSYRAELPVASYRSWWQNHPNPAIDVVVTSFTLIEQLLELDGVNLYHRTIGASQLLTPEQITDLDAVEDVVFIGYPNAIWDSVNLLPVVRKGITATPAYADFLGQKQFLIDAAVFPGSSGSPVFLYNPSGYYARDKGIIARPRLHFLGILTSVYYAAQTNELRIVDIPTDASASVTSRDYLNLGLVIKTSTIIETIEVFLRQVTILPNK